MPQVPEEKVDQIQVKLRDIFEAKSGFKGEAAQSRLLSKHFQYFDSDSSGKIDFEEFTSAMLRLNFVGVQAEIEALFDRFDEDLNGVISYDEFSKAICSKGKTDTQTPHNLLAKVKQKILDSGGKNGIRTLSYLLRRMDQNGNQSLEKDELYDGLIDFGLNERDFSDGGEFDKVFRYFDRDDSGKITIDEMLRGLRGSMPKRRILIVKEAFKRLDTSGDGIVTIEDINDRYDASQHPEVISGRMSLNDALLEMMKVFEEGEADGKISWHEFLGYYKDLSAGINHDDEFELMIRNAWHISGGEGWCQNSSCRRVLVTHKDGTQEVVEIEDDLGIGANDISKMKRKLRKQGIKDIYKISLAD